MKRIASYLTRMIFFILLSPLLVLTQNADDGALSILYAVTSSNAESGAYYGPSGLKRKFPKRVESNEASHDEEVVRRLWEVSSELTGVKFNI